MNDITVIRIPAFLVIFLFISGCIHPAGQELPTSLPITPVTPVPVLTSDKTPTVLMPVIPNSTVSPSINIQNSTPKENPDAIIYKQYSDKNFKMEYPATWSYAETIRPLREAVWSKSSCIESDSYVFKEKIQRFSSRQEDVSLYVVTVDTTDRPGQESYHIKYGAYINSIINNANLCSSDRNETITINGVQLFSGYNSLMITKIEYSVDNETGFVTGRGISYSIPGYHHRGSLIFYSPSDTFNSWYDVMEHMLNSITLDPSF